MRRINRDLRRSPFLDAALIKKSEYGFSAKVVISIRVRTKTALVNIGFKESNFIVISSGVTRLLKQFFKSFPTPYFPLEVHVRAGTREFPEIFHSR